jgi:hypothetical protein
LLYLLSALLFTIVGKDANALPIGFGHTQGGLQYQELQTPNFIIYHDQDVSGEAQAIATSLEAARPHLESWFQVRREKPLPVVSTAIASGASFANFLTDAVELQTLGQGHRDLYWHEYVHSTMYRQLDNWLGPSGSMLHLIWMPSWFIEGLPEALTVSIGSDEQASYERYHALTGLWPSYDRLHSLYGGQGFASQGYATSGAFVAYLFRKYGADALPKVLERFYWNSMPWWVPWAALPYGPFLPMDDALKSWTGKDGRELYLEYQKEAKLYWEKHSRGAFLSLRKGKRIPMAPNVLVWQEGERLIYGGRDKGHIALQQLQFDPETGFAISKGIGRLPTELDSVITAGDGKLRIGLRNDQYQVSRLIGQSMAAIHDGKSHEIAKVEGSTIAIGWTGKKAAWIEARKGRFRFCSRSITAANQNVEMVAKARECSREVKNPKSVQVLGMHFREDNAELARGIYFSEQSQTLTGDRFSVWYWDIDANRYLQISTNRIDRPIAAGATKDRHTWLLSGERSHQSIRKLNAKGQCLGQMEFADHMVGMWAFKDGGLVLRLRTGTQDQFLRINPSQIVLKPCEKATGHTSPLLVAMQSDQPMPINQAFETSDLWKAESGQNAEIENRPLLGEEPQTQNYKSAEAQARFRPVFSMPWIGVDAGGLNFGFLSVPLMDHMQNDTVTLTALVGIQSRYPSLELSYITTRFWPLLKFDAFRYQEWNGIYRRSDGSRDLAFVDRRGGRATSMFYWAKPNIDFNLFLESSYIDFYAGPLERPGSLNEVGLNLSRSFRLGETSLFVRMDGRSAPEAVNSNYNFHRLSLFTNMAQSYSFLNSRLAISTQLSATRGPRKRELQEIFRPIRIFIPGAVGGLNNVNFQIADFDLSGGKAFSSIYGGRFGDTQARIDLNYNFPIIARFDTLLRMFYLKSLEFASFLNAGTAWNASTGVTLKDFIPAAGASADLLLDLNGVKFNMGLGVGHVIRTNEALTLYATFGFDNLLEVNQQ